MDSVLSKHPSLPSSAKQIVQRLLAYTPSEPDDFTVNKRASVLVPISLNKDGDFDVLLTLRSSKLRTQPGQISFPGGRMDPTDKTKYDAALREAHEEIGLERSEPVLLAELNPRVSMAQAIVTPFVAIIPDYFVSKPNEHEVDAVFKVPLRTFLQTKGKSYVDFHLTGFGPDVYERNHGWHVTPAPTDIVYSPHFHTLVSSSAIPFNPGPPTGMHSPIPQAGDPPPQRRPPPGIEMTLVPGREGPQPRFRVFGLTADIAIEAAIIAYGSEPGYLFRLQKQPSSRGLVQMWIDGGQLGRGQIIGAGKEEESGDHSDPSVRRKL